MAFLIEAVEITTDEAVVVTEGVFRGVAIIRALIMEIKGIFRVTMALMEVFPNPIHNPTRISPNPTQISQTQTLTPIAQLAKFAINKATLPLIATTA